MKKHLLFIAGLAVFISAPALANPPCLEFGRIWNWKVVDNKTVIVEDDTHQNFKFGLMGYCPEIQFYRDTLGFESHGGTRLSCMTPGDDVIVHTAGIHQRCPISTIVPYTQEMEKAEKVTAQDTKEKGDSSH